MKNTNTRSSAMKIFIQNSAKFDSAVEDLCDKAGITYGAAPPSLVRSFAQDCENRVAIFPDHIRPGAECTVRNGHAVLVLRREKQGWCIRSIKSSRNPVYGIKEKLTVRQKVTLKQIDDEVREMMGVTA
jgi:hypothetical protein